jgi:CRP-like cAMP-binding protein
LFEALSLHEVDQRLARFLLDEGRAHGRSGDKKIKFELALTNQQIAARIGTVREVVPAPSPGFNKMSLLR